MSWTAADAVDYKGFPADKSRTGGWVSAALILGMYSLIFQLIWLTGLINTSRWFMQR